MVDRQGHVALGPHYDALGALFLDDRRALFELADAENCRLCLIDHDGRGEQAAGGAVIGECERAAVQVRGRQLLRTCARDEIIETTRDVKEIAGFDPAQYRYDESAAAERGGDAHIDRVVDLQRILAPAAIRFRHGAYRIHRRRDEIGAQRERGAALRQRRRDCSCDAR